MKRLKEAGIRNLLLGLAILMVASAGLRYLLGTWLVYNNEALLDIMYDETAAALRFRNVIPGMILPVIAFVWMYLNYAGAIDWRAPHVTAHEKRHAVIPGIVLVVAEFLLLVVWYYLTPGMLSMEEFIYRFTIVGEVLKASLAGAGVDILLYVLSALFLKPDILSGK